MKALVLGATGATGRLVVKTLLERNIAVKAVVRSPEKLSHIKNGNLTVIETNFLDIPDGQVMKLIEGCDAVISCLGHNLTLKGIYGKPRFLVRDSIKRLCRGIESLGPNKPIKIILMNTTGNRNREEKDKFKLFSRFVIFLLRYMLPPQADNEKAAEFLVRNMGRENSWLQWVAVRPDTLIDEDSPSAVTVHPTVIRDPLLAPGKTSRINVARFMVDLLSDDKLWEKWRGRMPVIYNRE